MAKHKNKSSGISPGRLLLTGFVGLAGLGMSITMLLQGTDIALFDPKGPIAQQQHGLMVLSAAVLLSVAVPTLILLYFFAWKYRESNQKATYDPTSRPGKLSVFSMWAVPSFFMLVLALVMWPATHRLQPQKLIAANAKPLTIQVVAMRWKWLFIYPDQNIATVNFVQVPTDTPVQFELSADDTPMSSFWIPHLGGQLYAMTGHVNRLNLLAVNPGDYQGSSAEINGAGFAGMKFIARASTKESFDLWVKQVKQSPNALDTTEYAKLLAPSENNPAAFYSQAQSDLYDNMLLKYNGSHDHAGHQ